VAVPYATLDDVFLLGLGAQAFASRPRPVAPTDVSLATGVIRLEAHGLAADDLITLRVTAGGALATALSAFTVYGVEVVSFDLFRIVASGVPITSYVSAGSGWSVVIDPVRRLERLLLDTAAIIDDKLTAHAPPLETDPDTGRYPDVAIGLNARLTAMAGATTLQFENPVSREAIDRLQAQIDLDWENLRTYLAGRPMNPRPIDQNTIADNGARAGAGTPVNWQTGYL
jgi:hypothetical protein